MKQMIQQRGRVREPGLAVSFCLLAAAVGLSCGAQAEELQLRLRDQRELAAGNGRFERAYRDERWATAETAVIICDVWDLHHCRNAVRRLEEFAPRLNQVLAESRRRGATIIHSPSDCMPAYAEHPARQRATSTPRAKQLPRDIESWCSRIPTEERAVYPIDQSDGGEDDDPAEHAEWAAQLKLLGRNPAMPWKRQSDMIEIDPERDYISDRGDEVWNILEQRGIKNVILTGVHTNMCVLGRPFGLRQMARNGKNVVLMRDMTDCMYNPRRWPYVDHFTGNDLIVSHVERFVCPTITSDQVLGGEPFRSKSDARPKWDVAELAAARVNPPDRATFENQWSLTPVPTSWATATGGAMADYDGVAWYRCTVRVPRSWAAPDGLRLAVPGAVRARAWFNGHSLEATDSVPQRGLRIKPDWIAPDDANLLVLRVEHASGDGGPDEVLSVIGGTELKLRGRWQFRLGDDATWSNMPLPARFGTSTDILFEPPAAPVNSPKPDTSHPIRVNNPRRLPDWQIPTERIAIGPGYKPSLVRLRSGELVMVALFQEMKDGKLVTEWTGLWRSSDDGRSWTERERVKDLIGREQWLTYTTDGTLFATCHLLEQDQNNKDGVTHSYIHRSTDGGRSWARTRIVSEELPHTSQTMCSRNVVELPDGTLMLGVGLNGQPGRVAYASTSKDNGKTWQTGPLVKIGRYQGREYDNYDCFFTEDFTYRTQSGKLLHWIRCGPPSPMHSMNDGRPTPRGDDSIDRTMWCESTDGGLTWSDVRDFGEYGRMYPRVLRLADGRLLMTYTQRSLVYPIGLRGLVSHDDGATWDFAHDQLVIEGRTPWGAAQGGGFGNTLQLADGSLISCYSYRAADGQTYIEVARWRLPASSSERDVLARRLDPYLQPPAEFAGQLGSYRSPLKFTDGSVAKSADDWARRRQEILDTWNRRLGAWPALVERPTVKVLESIQRDGYAEHHVHVQISPDGKLADGYLLVPSGPGPYPAVLVPFYEPLTSIGRGAKGSGTHDYGLQLVRRGFVTLSIGTPGSVEKIGLDTRQLLTEAGIEQRRQPLTLLAYVAANCHTALAQMREVDPARIGIIGLSYGGKWSMFSSCLYDKFACAVWSDPGIVFNEQNANVNYWEPWYLGYDPKAQRKPGVPSAERPRTGLYKELIDAGDDLVDLHALIAPRPVLVSGGTEDPPRNWQALNHLVAVNELLGHRRRVGMTARRTHVPTAEALELELAFLEYWLKHGDNE